MNSPRSRSITALFLLLSLPLIGIGPAFGQTLVPPAQQGPEQGPEITRAGLDQSPDLTAGPQKIGGASGAGGALSTPTKLQPTYSVAMPEITVEQLAEFDRVEARRERAYKAVNNKLEPNPDHPVVAPEHYVLSDDGQYRSDETSVGTESLADGTFTVFRNADVFPAGSSRSVINEPAHAQIGKNVFFTGNWYAARSANGGVSYSYLSPYTGFANFCCDQDVIHDESRNLMLWYRQGSPNASGVNQILLSGSTNGGASFFTYTLSPTTFDGSLTNRWFDYPHLAVSNDYLYITTNVFNAADVMTNRIVIRLALEQLAAGAAVPFYRWTFGVGATITPVQGATETMYFGATESSAGTFRVFTWPESTTVLSSILRAVPAWTSTTRGSATCAVPNGRNPCGRTDQRVTGGWVAKGIIGFFWNVRQGGGFPYPYINAATFRESDRVYLARPYIWSTSTAWIYGAAAPNKRGDLGIAALVAGGSQGYPRFVVGIDDDFNGAPPGWQTFVMASSTNWGLTNAGGEGAGDYLRVRQFSPISTIFSASGYYGLGSPVSYRGRFVTFGRGREQRGWNRWSLL